MSMSSSAGVGPSGVQPGVYSQQDPMFLQGLDLMVASTPAEKLQYLESFLDKWMSNEERAALCYYIIKEKSPLSSPDDLRREMEVLMGLPLSSTVNFYKMLATICCQFSQYRKNCEGLNDDQIRQLLTGIENAEERYLKHANIFSIARCLQEAESLKNQVNTWYLCPLLQLARKSVCTSLMQQRNQVTSIFLKMSLGHQGFEGEKRSQTYHVSSVNAISSLDEHLIYLWHTVPHIPGSSLQVSINVEMLTADGSGYFPYEFTL